MVVVHFTATVASSIMRLTHVLKYMSKSHKAVILFTSVDVDIVKKGPLLSDQNECRWCPDTRKTILILLFINAHPLPAITIGNHTSITALWLFDIYFST
jgi:hypothetical protein